MKAALAFLLCFALAGCTTMADQGALDQQTRMADALDPWIGQSIAAYAAERGLPTSYVKLDDHTTAFRWVMIGSSNGAIIPFGSTMTVAPPRQLECTVVFEATSTAKAPELKDFLISGHEWQGNC